MFETSPGNSGLIELYGRAVERPSATSVAYEIYSRMPNDTDLSVFKNAGLAGLNFAFIDGFRRYHTKNDDLAHLDSRSLQHHGDQALALTRAAGDDVQLVARAPTNRVYFDLLGRGFVSFEASVAIVLSLVALAAIAFASWRARISWRALASCALLHVVSMAAAAGLATLLVFVTALISGVRDPWAAEPQWTRGAVFASACSLSVFVHSSAWARRAAPEAASICTWLVSAILALALSLSVPGASYLALVPALIAAALSFWRPANDALRFARSALPAIGALVVGAPIVFGLELAFEYELPLAIAVAVAMLADLFAPVFVADPSARRASLALGGLSIVALVIACVRPAHTPDSPARLSLVRVEDTRSSSASIVALTYRSELSESMRKAAMFEEEPRLAFDGFGMTVLGYHTAVATVPLTPPHVEMLDEQHKGSVRTLRARIRSDRGATRFFVNVAAGAKLLSGSYRGQPGEIAVYSSTDGARSVSVSGIGEEGFEIVIAADASRSENVARDGKIEMQILEVRTGETLHLEPFAGARAPNESAIGGGDMSIVVTSVTL